MTEFEYEKAARGPVEPVSGEYAWGSTTLVQSVVILGDESARPIVQGNCNIGNPMQLFQWRRQSGTGARRRVSGLALSRSRRGHPPRARVEQTFAARGRRVLLRDHGPERSNFGSSWSRSAPTRGRSYLAEHGNGNLDAAGPEAQIAGDADNPASVSRRSWYEDQARVASPIAASARA
jgi:hypothetical protein